MRAVIHKESVRQLAEQTIEAEAEARERDEGFDAERLLADLEERLEDEDELESFERCSIAELVERICRDLGVAFAPYLLDDTDWDIPVPAERPIRLAPDTTAPGTGALVPTGISALTGTLVLNRISVLSGISALAGTGGRPGRRERRGGV